VERQESDDFRLSVVGRSFPDSDVRQESDSRESSPVFVLGSMDPLRFDDGCTPELDYACNAGVAERFRTDGRATRKTTAAGFSVRLAEYPSYRLSDLC